MELATRTVIAGNAAGPALVLDEPLSLWGGLDAETGCITDVHHPQHGECVTDTILVMANGRGSSSASSVLAEAIRLGTAPAAFILNSPDEIIALGSLVGHELYDVATPIVIAEPAATSSISTGDYVSTQPGITGIDHHNPAAAARIVQIQMVAYAVEANLIGFDGIPQLSETANAVSARSDLTWIGAFNGFQLVGVIAWTTDSDSIDIDRLAVHPDHSRRGYGRRLVRSVPAAATTTVSTGAANAPAVALYESEGFAITGQTEIAPGVFTSQFARTR